MSAESDVIAYRHARDIPDTLFLACVWKAGGSGKYHWAIRSQVDRFLGGYSPDDDLSQGVPGVPWRVSLAKAKRLIGRGLLCGCTCGCRGDYYLTDAGKALLFGSFLPEVEVTNAPL